MSALYNDIEPFAIQWLGKLVQQGCIAPGEVVEKSIEDIVPYELDGFAQCHFFAGIGVWSYALRLAGWPDDRPVWTGSCPCQPFSTAGKRTGFADERHLWPSFFHLIKVKRPLTVFGEQVASPDGLSWCDTVFADLESEGYSCGAVDTCAAGFGAPHIRQRLYWFGTIERIGTRGGAKRLEYAQCEGLQGQSEPDRSTQGWQEQAGCPVNAGNETCRLGNAYTPGFQDKQPDTRSTAEKHCQTECGNDSSSTSENTDRPMPTNGFWSNPDWIFCRDRKWRPIEPNSTPLAHGAANTVGRLRGYGNAIVAPQAAAFIRAVMELLP